MAIKAEAETMVLIGETAGHLGQSLYLREIEGREDGAPPPVDLSAEKLNGDFVRGLITETKVTACHDVSDGGILVAVAEMALAGKIGATLQVPEDGPPAHAWLFGEDQGRYLLALPETSAAAVLERAAAADIPAQRLGRTGGKGLTVNRVHTISIADLRRAHAGWLPAYMASPTT